MTASPSPTRCLVVLLLAVPAAAQAASAAPLLARQPNRFVPNEGQWNSPELFRMRVGGMHLFLEQDGWSFWLREAAPTGPLAGAATMMRASPGMPMPGAGGRALAVRMTFVGAGVPVIVPENPLAGVSNYLVGSDPAQHRAGVPGFASVLYRSMYPGIDVRVREAGGVFEYDLLLAPGADLQQVRVRVDGTSSVAVEHGALVLQTGLGELRQPAPSTWVVTASGQRRPVRCAYVRLGDATFGFAAPDRDPDLALVVDPPLVWSSYVGGTAYDEPTFVKDDGTGRLFVTGYTESTDFPFSTGTVQQVLAGTGDGFVMLIDPSLLPGNQVIFSTYFGGNAFDFVSAVEDVGGQIAIAGRTTSTDLPVPPAIPPYQAMNAGGNDAFVGLLDATGSMVIGLTYFGGSNDDGGFPSLHHHNNELYLCGNTISSDLPTTANAYDPTLNSWDGFVAKFDLVGTSLLYSTYLGGTSNDGLWAGDLDANGVLTLIADTVSPNYPMSATAFDPTPNGAQDCVVARFDPNAANPLVYSSYCGGQGSEYAYCVAVAGNGDLVVSGGTTSTNFPVTAGAYQTTFAGGGFSGNAIAGDGYVLRIDPATAGAAGLVAGTYFGGNWYDQGLEADVDTDGVVTLVGWLNVSSTVPTTPGAMRRTHLANDGYIARLSADLSQLLYGSYVGGTAADGAWIVDRTADGVATVFAQCNSFDAPMQNAFQPTNPGGSTPFLGRYWLIPYKMVRRGAPTPAGNRSPTMHALDDATPGNAQFGIACSRAPAGGIGLLGFSFVPLPGVPVLGVGLWLDPTMGGVLDTAVADAAGEHVRGLPLPAWLLGGLHTQYFWIEDFATLTLSASDALQIQ
jgi:hypothetical protein